MKRHIEVLFVHNDNERIIEVFLHKEDTILHESIGDFICRSLRPHEYLFEVRSINLSDDRAKDYLWYLMTIPHKNVCKFKSYVDAFNEIFLIANSYYQPTPLIPFDKESFGEVKEEIIAAACIFPYYDKDEKQYHDVIILGNRHCDCFEIAFNTGLKCNRDVRQGFITTKNRFLDRYEAKSLALANGQLKEDTLIAELYSEDLW